MDKVDFVLLWVDSNDPKWREQKNKFKNISDNNLNNDENRFRDWDLLKYWFRGVEKYANWVNKIHFVTCGQKPKWLNTNHPKIHIVNHEDYIPKEYLPTFNSNVIQYYLFNIPGISERIVLFDDDQYILKKVKEEDFFVGNKICDEYGENIIFPSVSGDVYPHSLLNNVQCINKHYSKWKVYKQNFSKYFNIKYGIKNNIKTMCLLPWSFFPGFYNPHICQSYTKKSYELFWDYCKEELKQCSKNKFRKNSDLTTFLIRYISLVEGDFIPRRHSFGKRIELKKKDNSAVNLIKKQKYSVLCINDSSMDIEFEKVKEDLRNAFEQIFPNKSKFEL